MEVRSDGSSLGTWFSAMTMSTRTFRWTFIWTTLLASSEALVRSLIEASRTVDALSLGMALISTFEIAAIIAFAVERFRPMAVPFLLAIFAIALAWSTVVEGSLAARFIYFGASVIYLQRPSRYGRQLLVAEIKSR